jgi:RNA polymerase-binding transcription factor DksA
MDPRTDGALDLDRIEQDLADAEVALARLDAGTYFTDEVTGQPLDEAVLSADPLARRNRD